MRDDTLLLTRFASFVRSVPSGTEQTYLDLFGHGTYDDVEHMFAGLRRAAEGADVSIEKMLAAAFAFGHSCGAMDTIGHVADIYTGSREGLQLAIVEDAETGDNVPVIVLNAMETEAVIDEERIMSEEEFLDIVVQAEAQSVADVLLREGYGNGNGNGEPLH